MSGCDILRKKRRHTHHLLTFFLKIGFSGRMKILNAGPGLLSQRAEVPEENKGIEQERNAAGVCVCVCVCVCMCVCVCV